MASYKISNGGTLDTSATAVTSGSVVAAGTVPFTNPTTIEFLNQGSDTPINDSTIGGVLILSDNSASNAFVVTSTSLGGGSYATSATINATIMNFQPALNGPYGDEIYIEQVDNLFNSLDGAPATQAGSLNTDFFSRAAAAAADHQEFLIDPNGSVQLVPGSNNITFSASEDQIIEQIAVSVFGTTASAQNSTLALYFVHSRQNPNANVTAANAFFLDAVITAESGSAVNPVIPCFAAGTRILTIRGEVAVEALRVGDVVITESGEDAPIIWIGRREIALSGHPRPETVRPVVIEAEALGDGVPARRLTVSPDHAFLLDGVLVPAKALLNWTTIRQDAAVEQVTYYHIELPAHGILFAEGAAAESFLDTGHRAAFEDQEVALHPAAFEAMQARRAAESCAKLVYDGPELAAIRQRLAARQVGVRLAGAGD